MKILTEKLTTFYIGSELFGIEVLKVQEVTGPTKVVEVPLAPRFVSGLVNLRGQIATAISLGELFSQNPTDERPVDQMSVVCRVEGNLISLFVDSIGEVVEVEQSCFEKTPTTVAETMTRFIKGIYKMDGIFLNVLDTDTLFNELSSTNELIGSK